ncbi:LuxR C-terminal-related transcriptional regulator [Cohnella sp. GCM10027633]|uniref:LuxR C-terminal-related transcriptional regulator n=1 Tax=unclassified Cohnella TaxID=2636738 RepID=UPI00362772E6
MHSDQEQGGSFEEREDYYFVGRGRELDRFGRFLAGQPENRTLWHVSGTGGMGKTTLLAAFRRMADRAGASFLLVDSRDFPHREDEICRAILALLGVAPDELPGQGSGAAAWLDACIGALREQAKIRRVVLAFDTFEELTGIETWLRERLFARLSDRVLLIAAGRLQLGGAWAASPAWRERTLRISLDAFTREEAAAYALRCGLSGGEEAERVWRASLGHPLAMSLATAHRTGVAAGYQSPDGRSWLHEMADVWLKEAADAELRVLVEAASLPNRFDGSLLAAALGVPEVCSNAFDRLIRLSFIRKAEQGWVMHDIMRDAVSSYLRERAPDRCRTLSARLACCFADRILASAGTRNAVCEVGELYQFVGGEAIAAYYRGASALSLWEQVNSETVNEAEHYVRMQAASPSRTVSLAAIDPESRQEVRASFSEALPKASLQGVDPRAWYDMDNRCLFLLRGDNREVAGLAAIIPIHAGTLAFMEQDPFSAPYMATLSVAVRRSMATLPDDPVGWFIRAIDYRDWTDERNQNQIFSLLFSYVCSGRLLLASPPPIDSFMDAHERMGFEAVAGSEHGCYENFPAPMLILDTRGTQLAHLLSQLLRRQGIAWRQAEEASASEEWATNLSAREREAARLAAAGLSNAEIAMQLYISEVTVKKHLSAAYDKLGIRRRSQLAARLG